MTKSLLRLLGLASFGVLVGSASASCTLIYNGDFELSTGTGFSWVNYGYDPTPIIPGWNWTVPMIDLIDPSFSATQWWPGNGSDYAISLVGTPGTGTIDSDAWTQAGGTYSLCFDYYGNNGNAYDFYAEVWSTSSGLLASALYTSQHTPQTVDCGELNYTVGSPSEDIFVRFYATPNNPNQYPGPFIDNVGYCAVPEPASMAVLGIGALGLLKRRRKA